MRNQGGQNSLSKAMVLSLGADRGGRASAERSFVPVPWSPERWGRAGGACFGVALPGIRRSARDFACGGRDPLCPPGPAGEPPSAQSPGYVRERLDQDLQTGDRINDLYFTSDFLLVYQLQVRSKQSFACIPYPEIGGVSIGQNGGAKNQLDILSPEGTVLHTVTYSLEVSQAQAEEIGRKILSLKSRIQAVKNTAEEQAQQDQAVKQALKKTLSGLPAFFCSLAAVLGFLASIVMAEHFREKAELLEALQFPADAYGALLFWPNLLFYVVMYGGILVMLLCGVLLVRNLFHSREDAYLSGRPRSGFYSLSEARSCSSS